MRLKEIKEDMIIHCKTQEEANMLCEALGAEDKWKAYWKYAEDETCYHIHSNDIRCYGTISSFTRKITEFSDLIIPEMSAEEVLQIVKKLEFEFVREYLGLPYGKSLDGMLFDAEPRKIIDMCEQWKSDHEKKEPEIETVDICRIIEVLPDGRKRCVHEKDIKSEFPFGGDEREKVEEILKRYCIENDGEYIAVHEVVSRVKAVE